MSGLTLVALVVFLAGFVGILITSLLQLSFSFSSKVLNFFFVVSGVIYGIAGFTIVILSFIYEFIK